MTSSALRIFWLIGVSTFVAHTVVCQVTWQNPIPQGNDLNGVFFRDSCAGWAVGRVGALVATKDAGNTWQVQESSTNQDLYSVYFVDDLYGWIGGDGIILGTTDGGAHWVAQSSGFMIGVQSVFFLDRFNGWACGDSTLFSTKDGGKSWTEGTLSGSVHLRTLTFTTPAAGWVAGDGALFRTTDAGMTWAAYWMNNESSHMYFDKVIFADASTGWVFGSDLLWSFPNSIGWAGNIWRTSNGGSTWQNVYLDSLYFSFYYPTSYFSDCAFGDANTGLFTSVAGTFLTADGGLSWTKVTNAPQTHIAMLGSELIYAVGSGGSLLKSYDQGSHWQELSKGTRDAIVKVQFFSNSTGVAIGNRGSTQGADVLRTLDAGKTWLPTTTLFNNRNISLTGFSFVDSLRGWVSASEEYQGTNFLYGSGTVFQTTDGGYSWAQQLDDSSYYRLWDIQFPDGSHGFASGDNTVLRTDDGGGHWQRKYGGQLWLYSLFVRDLNNVWAGGYDGFATSSDGGTTWMEGSVLAGMQYYDVKSVVFTGSSIGWSAGAEFTFSAMSGFVLKSTDGGKTWDKVASAPNLSFNKLLALDSEHVWAVGDNGMLAYTSNGGASWHFWTVPHVKISLRGFFTLDNVSGWVIGDGGTIIRIGDLSLITSVANGSQPPVPHGFVLEQNYPNPFNPSTTIKYELPKSSIVRLSVYDILGREVSVLVNERKNAGFYEVKFDAARLSSGVYFYRIQTGSFVKTMKCLLVK